MRLRNIPGANDIVEACPFCINEPTEFKGKWKDLFGNDNPIYIEIGMGKGQFIIQMSERYPDINFIGIERYSSVIIRAISKLEDSPLDNLRLICFDAKNLADIFDKDEISRIYLNFSDPWPKDRHAKRRLTSPVFLDIYNSILKSDGQLQFKTDNTDLFNYSLETVSASQFFNLENHTFDLHNDNTLNDGNIMTEYEEKFSSMGNPICKLIATKKAR